MTEAESKALIYLILGICAGIFLFWVGFKLLKKVRFIENIPTSKARSVALGLVEIAGKALKYQPSLLTPFAKIQCVFYRYIVEELRGSGKHRRWVTIAANCSASPFYIQDETGKILINPKDAELHLDHDHQYQNGFFWQGDKEKFIAGLQTVGINPKGFLGNKSLRCEEYYIQENDNVYVMGTAINNPDISGSATGSDNIMIGKSGTNFFFISDKSEKKLLGNLKLKCYASLCGGPVLTVGCLYFLVQYFLR